jgi:spore coat polysaccharide biosynthesis predicted glycosyltransferase SpsG
MTRSPILFRCDGTSNTGYEGFYQCLNYAAALQRRRRGTYFLSNLQPESLLGPIQRAGNQWRPASNSAGESSDLEDTLRTISELDACAIVISAPTTSSDYLDTLARTGVFVVVLDSQACGRFPRGLLVNPLLGPNRESYLIDSGCQVLMGARYALVRPFIRRMRPVRAQEPPTPFRVIVAMGDDDVQRQSLPRCKELMAISRLEKIDVVVRPHHPDMPELLALKEQFSDRVDVLTEPADIALRVGRCHAALTSGDGWSLELACVGVPQLMLVQSPRHLLNAQRVDDEGAGTNLGDCESVSAGQLRQAVQNVIMEPRERALLSRAGRKLIDGRGPDRLVNALEIMLAHRKEPAVVQRVAA